VGGVERQLDVGSLGAGNLADRLAGDGADIVEIVPVDGGQPFSADEIVVAGPQSHARVQRLDDLMKHVVLPRTWAAFFVLWQSSSSALT
jgi:hypothetical protein